MAVFPCAVGTHRYSGPQSSAYLAIVNGGQSARQKLRMCLPHCKELETWLRDNLTLVAVGDEETAASRNMTADCAFCDERNVPWSAFANVYLRGELPLAFYASLCDEHMADFCEKGSLTL